MLNNHNFLFRFNSDKRTDRTETPIYLGISERKRKPRNSFFCNMRESKPEHQLIECPEVQGNSYQQQVTNNKFLGFTKSRCRTDD